MRPKAGLFVVALLLGLVAYASADFPTRPGGSSIGNSTFSGNDWTTSGSPTTIRTVHQFTATTYTFDDLATTRLGAGDYRLQPSGGGYVRLNADITIANPSESAFIKVQASGSTLVSGAISGDSITLAAAGALRLSDESAKGTCDSSITGKVKYEVAANVGTLYVCRQTGVGTYAWAALH